MSEMLQHSPVAPYPCASTFAFTGNVTGNAMGWLADVVKRITPGRLAGGLT